jgi:hypothetical protein
MDVWKSAPIGDARGGIAPPAMTLLSVPRAGHTIAASASYRPGAANDC